MPYIQTNLPKPPETLSWSINMFNGGLNNMVAETLIADNQASKICNVEFTEDSVIETRGGFKLVNTMPVNNIVEAIKVFNPTYADVKQITIVNGDVYIDNLLKLQGKNILNCTQFNDKYYFVNGVEMYVLGKFPQETVTHIKIWGTANPNETIFKIKAPPTGFTPLDNTNTIGLYNYNYDTMECWYEPCQNELNDEFKGANIFPTSPTILEVHGERLFIISDLEDPGSIYISDINNAMYHPASLGLHIPPKGDRIVGMTVFTDSIVVGTKHELYAIYGDTNRDTTGTQFSMKRINAHTGFKNNTSIKPMHNYLVYLGNDDNIYSMYTTKTDVSILMTNLLNKTVNLLKSPINATTEMLEKTSSVFYKDNMYFIVPDLKIILVFSYRHMAWTLYKTVLNIKSINIYNEKMLIGDSEGKIYEIDKETYSDNGEPFEAYWHSKRFSFGDETIYKKFKEMFVVAHTYNNIRSDVKITYEIDYVDIKQQEIVTNQISKWGITNFGERFITRNLSPSLPITIGQRGRYVKFILYNGYFIKEKFNTLIELQEAVKENQSCYYVAENDKYYFFDTGTLIEITHEQVKQPMKIYSVSGTYQLKGRR